MEVGRRLELSGLGSGCSGRRPLGFINDEEVEVAVIADFPTAQFAEPEQSIATSSKRIGAGRHSWDAQFCLDFGFDQIRHLIQDGIGYVGKRGGGQLNICLAQKIADADAQELLVLEAVQDGIGVAGSAAEFGELGPQFGGRPGLIQYQTIEQFIDHPRVIDQKTGEERTAGTQIDIELQARRVDAERLP